MLSRDRLRSVLRIGNRNSQYSSLPDAAFSNTSRSSIDRNSDDVLLEKEGVGRRGRSVNTPFWRSLNFWIVHTVIFGVYILGLLLATNSGRGCPRDQGLPFSPAVEALEYRDTTFTLEDKIQEKSRFTGRPSPELDQAWHDLLNAENIILEPEVMRHYGREHIGVAVPEGGGFLGTLNVYHELHCLKRIHQFVYSDHYFADFTPRQHELNRLHNEHCIDFLRQSVMCHGDVGLITYEWHDDSLIPVANATSHQCVNWEKLDRWTKERTVDMMKPGWLVHPTRGPAYPTGNGDKLGAVDDPAHSHGGH
ncbi:hypothetical protein HD806DRAFT_491733 [Xylariaceae sp. AK1471]|nr:hypothetical protein HD806DRAFT_491733 [Xylariaceae sp. AK1471]